MIRLEARLGVILDVYASEAVEQQLGLDRQIEPEYVPDIIYLVNLVALIVRVVASGVAVIGVAAEHCPYADAKGKVLVETPIEVQGQLRLQYLHHGVLGLCAFGIGGEL